MRDKRLSTNAVLSRLQRSKMLTRRSFFKLAGIAVGAVACLSGAGVLYWRKEKNIARSNLLIAGSSPMTPYIKKIAEEFSKSNSHLDIVVEKGHSRAGLLALQRSGIDIAMMDRDLKTKENSLLIRSTLIGIDAIAIIVHPDNPISSSSEEEVRDILEGKIKNWKTVGGVDAKINVLSRTEGSTTKSSVEDILMKGGLVTPFATEFENARLMVKAIEADEHSIGFISLRNLDGRVKALKIDDAEVSEQAILVGDYPLRREMFLVDAMDSTPYTRKFIDYALSDKGQTILAQAGWLRVR
jgi:phosphate transport system substrate-binding protein